MIINIELEELLFSAHKPFRCSAGDIMFMVLASRRWKLYHSSYHCGRVVILGSFDQLEQCEIISEKHDYIVVNKALTTFWAWPVLHCTLSFKE